MLSCDIGEEMKASNSAMVEGETDSPEVCIVSNKLSLAERLVIC